LSVEKFYYLNIRYAPLVKYSHFSILNESTYFFKVHLNDVTSSRCPSKKDTSTLMYVLQRINYTLIKNCNALTVDAKRFYIKKDIVPASKQWFQVGQ